MTGLLSLSAMTAGPWALIAGSAVLSLAVSSSTYWVTSRGYETTIARLESSQQAQIAQSSQRALSQFTTDWGLIHSAALSYQATQTSTAEKFNDLQKALDSALSSPLPAGCKPTADRLSVLNRAIRAANSAGAGLEPRSSVRPIARAPGGGL